MIRPEDNGYGRCPQCGHLARHCECWFEEEKEMECNDCQHFLGVEEPAYECSAPTASALVNLEDESIQGFDRFSGQVVVHYQICPDGQIASIFGVAPDSEFYDGERELSPSEEKEALRALLPFLSSGKGFDILNQAIEDELEAQDERRYGV